VCVSKQTHSDDDNDVESSALKSPRLSADTLRGPHGHRPTEQHRSWSEINSRPPASRLCPPLPHRLTDHTSPQPFFDVPRLPPSSDDYRSDSGFRPSANRLGLPPPPPPRFQHRPNSRVSAHQRSPQNFDKSVTSNRGSRLYPPPHRHTSPYTAGHSLTSIRRSPPDYPPRSCWNSQPEPDTRVAESSHAAADAWDADSWNYARSALAETDEPRSFGVPEPCYRTQSHQRMNFHGERRGRINGQLYSGRGGSGQWWDGQVTEPTSQYRHHPRDHYRHSRLPPTQRH